MTESDSSANSIKLKYLHEVSRCSIALRAVNSELREHNDRISFLANRLDALTSLVLQSSKEVPEFVMRRAFSIFLDSGETILARLRDQLSASTKLSQRHPELGSVPSATGVYDHIRELLNQVNLVITCIESSQWAQLETVVGTAEIVLQGAQDKYDAVMVENGCTSSDHADDYVIIAKYRELLPDAHDGSSNAQYAIAELFLQHSLKWMRKAAASGNTSAKENLALLDSSSYSSSSSSSSNTLPKGKPVLKSNLRSTSVASMSTPALNHREGESISQPIPTKSVSFGTLSIVAAKLPAVRIASPTQLSHRESLMLGAENGDKNEQYQLGCLLLQQPRNVPKAVEWISKAASAGHAYAQLKLGTLYSDEKYRKDIPPNYSDAMMWFTKSAAQGNLEAEVQIGRMYRLGLGVSEKNHIEAMKHFLVAAGKNYAPAQTAIGELYSAGAGVRADYAEALKWFHKAEQDDPVARFKIGSAYSAALGVPQNHAEAMKWYLKAADEYPLACKIISEMYAKGSGVKMSRDESARWMKLYEERLQLKMNSY